MAVRTSKELCEQCGRGCVVVRKEQIKFIQWTKRGYLICRVVVPIGKCGSCGAKIWDEVAESIIDEAVRQEYEKLPNGENSL